MGLAVEDEAVGLVAPNGNGGVCWVIEEVGGRVAEGEVVQAVAAGVADVPAERAGGGVDVVETEDILDEEGYGTESPEGKKDEPQKRGRGSQKKTAVLVLAETSDGTPKKTSDKPTAVKHIKMLVINDLKSETIDGKVRMYVNPSSTAQDIRRQTL